ncbi:MAG TPA: glycine/sarcosine/betaine reductase selenoprotein B family protein [Acidimicrobiia bacterium]|nr:glycine/sarcosine/betaine reductase selenoprotein B family protein [Acidimicrobiia bacterium]
MKLDPDAYRGKYDQWVEFIAANHQGSNPREVEHQQFSPLAKPLSEARVALVSSAGVHLDDQPPFHVETVAGDPSYRLIPDGVDLRRLRFTHTHYDTASAERDPNVVFPLDRLHEAVADGRVGSASPVHVGMMGFNPDPRPIADQTAPALAGVLGDAEVDVAVMVPG